MSPLLVKKVFNFLWVVVWGKINIWQFLMLNKHYIILVGSNIILSLLFIYMAEQTTVRTNQYRTLTQEVKEQDVRIVTLRKEIETLTKRNHTLIDSFGMSDAEIGPAEILEDYNKWAAEVRALEQDINLASQRLGAENERSTSTENNPSGDN